MENNLSSGNMNSGGPGYLGLDLQGSVRVNHPQHPNSLQHPEVFTLTMGQNHECYHSNSGAGYNKVDRAKNSPGEEEEASFNEGMDGQCDLSNGKKVSWQRVKWTDLMVRLMITAVSYLGEDALLENGPGGRRKLSALHKMGKWRAVSNVMAERGFYVSPQQCEDKFNDLNKRYKKLNDILGRGTSCQVVEKPALLDMMDHLSGKTKDEVRKILSSKQLFYEEMCSYHNNNRLHLPHDPALLRSLQLALRSRDDNDTDSKRHPHDDVDEDDHDVETDEHEEFEDYDIKGGCGNSSKRMKPLQGFGEFNFGNLQSFQEFSKGLQLLSQNPHVDLQSQNQWLKSRSLQLEEQKLRIELEKVDLEKQRFKWLRFSKKEDREFEKLKIENEKMKLENERMALDLKRMEMTITRNQ